MNLLSQEFIIHVCPANGNTEYPLFVVPKAQQHPLCLSFSLSLYSPCPPFSLRCLCAGPSASLSHLAVSAPFQMFRSGPSFSRGFSLLSWLSLSLVCTLSLSLTPSVCLFTFSYLCKWGAWALPLVFLSVLFSALHGREEEVVWLVSYLLFLLNPSIYTFVILIFPSIWGGHHMLFRL